MKIAYNKNTGEIIACGTHIDHMSSADVFLIDGFCNPGTGYVHNNQLVKFTNLEIEKYRNRPYYSSKWDNNIMSWVDDRSIDEIRNQKYNDIKNIANFTDVSDIEVNGYVYAADKASKNIIIQKLLVAFLLKKEVDFIIEWYLKDGSIIDLSFYQLKEVLNAIEDRSDRIFKMKKKLKELIFKSSKEIINSIRWPDVI